MSKGEAGRGGLCLGSCTMSSDGVGCWSGHSKRRMRRILRCAAALGSLFAGLTAAGCSDPKAATKENFQKVLTAFFDKNCSVLSAGVGSFPAEVDSDGFGQPSLLGMAPDDAIQALGQAGLFTTSTKMVDVGVFRHMLKEKLVLTLTDKGNALFQKSGGLGMMFPAGFCAGHVKVLSVDRFTQPATQNGQITSLVTVTAKASYDDWTRAPAIQKAFASQLGHVTPAPITLQRVQMDDGWAVSP